MSTSNTIAPVADAAFFGTQAPGSTATAWLGALAYTFQLYFDFSGYSDMAVGLGKMFGFDFPENFNRPYSAVSITDFWRRWHMTLSGWFRDYLFIPLGGSRGSSAVTVRNLAIVFAVTGLWHGAALSFIVWGCYHGALVIVERLMGVGTTDAHCRFWPLRRALTFVLVLLGSSALMGCGMRWNTCGACSSRVALGSTRRYLTRSTTGCGWQSWWPVVRCYCRGHWRSGVR